ncbi:MAG: hypothetical protein BroJett018_54810 [Chloroflexota bacterium]|nr:MAG: hypothetical protein BroJett018_54810 [Chloroflexota bacterium]
MYRLRVWCVEGNYSTKVRMGQLETNPIPVLKGRFFVSSQRINSPAIATNSAEADWGGVSRLNESVP